MRARALEQLPLFPELEPATARTRRKGPATSRGAEDGMRLSGNMGRGMYQALELACICPRATVKEMAALAALPEKALWSHFYRMDLQELRRRVSDCKLEKMLLRMGQRTGPHDPRAAEFYSLSDYGARVLTACRQKMVAQAGASK